MHLLVFVGWNPPSSISPHPNKPHVPLELMLKREMSSVWNRISAFDGALMIALGAMMYIVSAWSPSWNVSQSHAWYTLYFYTDSIRSTPLVRILVYRGIVVAGLRYLVHFHRVKSHTEKYPIASYVFMALSLSRWEKTLMGASILVEFFIPPGIGLYVLDFELAKNVYGILDYAARGIVLFVSVFLYDNNFHGDDQWASMLATVYDVLLLATRALPWLITWLGEPILVDIFDWLVDKVQPFIMLFMMAKTYEFQKWQWKMRVYMTVLAVIAADRGLLPLVTRFRMWFIFYDALVCWYAPQKTQGLLHMVSIHLLPHLVTALAEFTMAKFAFLVFNCVILAYPQLYTFVIALFPVGGIVAGLFVTDETAKKLSLLTFMGQVVNEIWAHWDLINSDSSLRYMVIGQLLHISSILVNGIGRLVATGDISALKGSLMSNSIPKPTKKTKKSNIKKPRNLRPYDILPDNYWTMPLPEKRTKKTKPVVPDSIAENDENDRLLAWLRAQGGQGSEIESTIIHPISEDAQSTIIHPISEDTQSTIIHPISEDTQSTIIHPISEDAQSIITVSSTSDDDISVITVESSDVEDNVIAPRRNPPRAARGRYPSRFDDFDMSGLFGDGKSNRTPESVKQGPHLMSTMFHSALALFMVMFFTSISIGYDKGDLSDAQQRIKTKVNFASTPLIDAALSVRVGSKDAVDALLISYADDLNPIQLDTFRRFIRPQDIGIDAETVDDGRAMRNLVFALNAYPRTLETYTIREEDVHAYIPKDPLTASEFYAASLLRQFEQDVLAGYYQCSGSTVAWIYPGSSARGKDIYGTLAMKLGTYSTTIETVQGGKIVDGIFSDTTFKIEVSSRGLKFANPACVRLDLPADKTRELVVHNAMRCNEKVADDSLKKLGFGLPSKYRHDLAEMASFESSLDVYKAFGSACIVDKRWRITKRLGYIQRLFERSGEECNPYIGRESWESRTGWPTVGNTDCIHQNFTSIEMPGFEVIRYNRATLLSDYLFQRTKSAIENGDVSISHLVRFLSAVHDICSELDCIGGDVDSTFSPSGAIALDHLFHFLFVNGISSLRIEEVRVLESTLTTAGASLYSRLNTATASSITDYRPYDPTNMSPFLNKTGNLYENVYCGNRPAKCPWLISSPARP